MERNLKHNETIEGSLYIENRVNADIHEVISFLETLRSYGATHIIFDVDEYSYSMEIFGEKNVYETPEETELREKEEKLKREEQENSRDLREYLRLKEKFGIKN